MRSPLSLRISFWLVLGANILVCTGGCRQNGSTFQDERVIIGIAGGSRELMHLELEDRVGLSFPLPLILAYEREQVDPAALTDEVLRRHYAEFDELFRRTLEETDLMEQEGATPEQIHARWEAYGVCLDEIVRVREG